MSKRPPKVFISYSWDDEDHKEWVEKFASCLKKDGIHVILDQWNVVPGDQLPAFMERAVKHSKYVLCLCTPGYKKKSEKRRGGVGYEGHIITAEMFDGNQRKFIPILRNGEWKKAAPSWMSGKVYIDLRGNPYDVKDYQALLMTLQGKSTKTASAEKQAQEDNANDDKNFEFVNREIELGTLEKFYDSYWQTALISAPTGYGKSRLLLRLLDKIQEKDGLKKKWNCCYIDLASCKNPENIVDYVWARICGKRTGSYTDEEKLKDVCREILDNMSKPVGKGPARGVLLILDSIECVQSVDTDWIFRVFHGVIIGSYIDYERNQVAVPVRLIVSGTSAEAFWKEYKKWETTSKQRRFLRAPQTLTLSAFKKIHVEELISRRAKDRFEIGQETIEDIADKLLYLSGGHPSVINGIMDDLFKVNLRGYDDYLRENRRKLVKKYVSVAAQKILRHFPLLKDQKDIKTICTFRLIDLKTLNKLQMEGLTTANANISLLGQLCEEKILKLPSAEKLFYHDDIIRRILYLDLAFKDDKDIQHVQKTHECAKTLYCDLIDINRGNYSIHYFFVEWLFHTLQIAALNVDAIVSEWKFLLSKIQADSVPLDDQLRVIKEKLDSDNEVRYLYRDRFGNDNFSLLLD
jgi:hypothetical protein